MVTQSDTLYPNVEIIASGDRLTSVSQNRHGLESDHCPIGQRCRQPGIRTSIRSDIECRPLTVEIENRKPTRQRGPLVTAESRLLELPWHVELRWGLDSQCLANIIRSGEPQGERANAAWLVLRNGPGAK